MRLSQQALNNIFRIVIFLALVTIITHLFNLDPLTFYGNLIVYFLLAIGAGLVVPAVLGFVWSLLIKLSDDKFGKRGENLPVSIHFWTAFISAAIIGWLWAKNIIPLISQSDSLSVWPNDWFQFRTVYEGYTSWGWVFFVAVSFAFGYAFFHSYPKKSSAE